MHASRVRPSGQTGGSQVATAHTPKLPELGKDLTPSQKYWQMKHLILSKPFDKTIATVRDQAFKHYPTLQDAWNLYLEEEAVARSTKDTATQLDEFLVKQMAALDLMSGRTASLPRPPS